MTSDAQAPTVPESLGQSWILATVPGLEGSTTIALLVSEDVQTLVQTLQLTTSWWKMNKLVLVVSYKLRFLQ